MSARRMLEQAIQQFKQEYGKNWQQQLLESIRDSGSVGFQLRSAMQIALDGHSNLAEKLEQKSEQVPREILEAQAIDRFMTNFDPSKLLQ